MTVENTLAQAPGDPTTTLGRLEALVRDGVLDASDLLVGDAVRARAGAWGWDGTDGCAADALVRPRTTEQLSSVLAVCHQLGQPVVTHGGVTGLVRGSIATAGEVVVSLERMNRIEKVDPIGQTLTVQAGCTLAQIQEAADAAGLKYGVDLGARGQCTIGGNIATNAGGNNVIRWGMTRQQVVGLEAVLADGTIVSDLRTMLKNNAGYDLKQLFIGTEGTLGIVTRAVLRLHPKPTTANTALLAVDDFDSLGRILQRAHCRLGSDLSAFEVMWQDFYRLVTTPPATNQPPLDGNHAHYVLVEALGSAPNNDAQRFGTFVVECMDDGLVADSVLATTAQDRQRLWNMRDDVEQLGRIAPFYTFDVSLAVNAMQGYIAQVERHLEERFGGDQKRPLHNLIFGHLGDGNLHFAIGVGSRAEADRLAIERAVYEPLGRVGGSVSAEHGVGLEKQPYLSITRSPAELSLMWTLKTALDPSNILNPGRVLPPETTQ
jgi:FAD/FMN-containing dehydrogenase